MTNIQVEKDPKRCVGVVSINVLQPAINKLVQVIAIWLTETTCCLGRCSRLCKGHFFTPAVIGRDRQDDIVVVALQSISKKMGAGSDVEFGIATVSARSVTTLVLCNLHEALFSGATDRIRVTATFLHGEGGKDDSRDTKFVTVLFKKRDIGFTGREGTGGRLDGRDKRDMDEIRYLNVGRGPTRASKAAVEPMDTAVGATARGCLLGCTDRATSGFNIDEAPLVSRSGAKVL